VGGQGHRRPRHLRRHRPLARPHGEPRHGCESCVDNDIDLPDDFISCRGCANRRLRETETRLELTELELIEGQAKLVKVEVRDILDGAAKRARAEH
jgi:hypothetical protein